MSYVGTKSNADWAVIKSGKEETVDFIHSRNPRSKFSLIPVYVKAPLAQYILSRARPRELNSDILDRFENAIQGDKLVWAGGFSGIHLDANGELIDIQHIQELMHAIISTQGSVEMGIYFGIPCGLINDFKVYKDKKPEPTQQFTKVEVKKPEYVMPYPSRGVALVMAYNAGTMKNQLDKLGKKKFTTHQATEWTKDNDNGLLKECMYGRTGDNIGRSMNRFLASTEINALRYITALVNPDKSREFFGLIHMNFSPSPAHPVTALKNKMSSGSAHTQGTVARMAWVIEAWNAWRSGFAITELTWSDRENFPKAV